MDIFGINRVHNASLSHIKDGEIVFHLENERLSGIKYDKYPFHLIDNLKEKIETLCIAGVGKTVPGECFTDDDMYSLYVKHRQKNKNVNTHDMWDKHHQLHATQAFYNSGFENALCIVKDGMGSEYEIKDKRFTLGTYGREISSTFLASYPANFKLIDKHVAVPFDCNVVVDNVVRVSNHLSEAMAFQKVSLLFGFHTLDAGKVMGMAPYGIEDKKIPPIYKNGFVNNELFSIKGNLKDTFVNVYNYPYLKSKEFEIQCNFAYKLQKETQKKVGEYILSMIEKTGCKNVCLSGGFFLNCVANYYYLSILPKDVNLYIEPISSDAGTSIGAAKYFWHKETEDTTVRKLNSLYLGGSYEIPNEGKEVTYDDVAQLLSERKVVAIYQGKSEGGPRALGNRSILYDPTDVEGKDIINNIKKRESFRPFAGTVLYEYASEWFDLRGLEESPFMMYAVDVIKDGIPAITHVDKTCRIQTLKQQQNYHYYNLINSFHKKTGVPILFNTSFNLAGECIVETPEDAIKTLKNSDIDYLYFPEKNLLIN